MFKIINGKRYDTSTASQVGEEQRYQDSETGDWLYSESLYLKKTGEFFLETRGGGNIYSPPDRLKPLSLDEAKKWGETHLNGEEYESVFGQVEEDDQPDTNKRKYTVLLPEQIIDALQEAATVPGKTQASLVIAALEAAGYGEKK